MRLVAILHSFSITGVLQQNLAFMKYVREHVPGTCIEVIGPKDDVGRQLYEQAGFTTHLISDVRRFLREEAQRPDVILSESLFSADCSAVARELGATHVIRVHEEIPYISGDSLWFLQYKPADEYFAGLTTSLVVFPSRHTAAHYASSLRRHGITYRCIPGTIDESRYTTEHRHGKAFTILQLGTIYKRKGTLRTLEAFKQFVEMTGADAKLELVGARNGNDEERAYTAAVTDAIHCMKLHDRVTIEGVMPDPSEHIARCSLMTLHTASECFPSVFLEAMYHGKPVVSTCVGGIVEQVIDGVTGILFDVGDTQAQANAFARIYLERENWAARSGLIRERYAKEFSSKHANRQLMEGLLEWMKSRS